jgi:tetratricopeptide (TPR) repeat protein
LLAGGMLLSIAPHASGQRANEAAIRSYSQQAEQAMASHNAKAAGAALEKLARLTPDVPEVYANLGTVYYAQGRYGDAAEAFQRALKLNPEIPDARLILGICYAELGRGKEAVPLLEPAFRHPPNSDVGRTVGISLMDAYTSLGRNTEALEITERLLDRYPNDPEVLYRASHLYGNRALQTMTRLVDVAPESPWKRMAFAEALEGQKRYDLAVIQYRKVIEADPSIPGVHYRLGRALLLNGKDSEEARDQAIREFQQAVASDPRNAGAQYELGEIYRQRGRSEQAIGYFSRAVDVAPRFEEAQIALARTLIHLQKPQQAVAHLRAAIELDPRNEVSHFLLAEAYKSLGERAKYQNEMALYNEYHFRPFAEKSTVQNQPPQALLPPEATKQTLQPEPSSRP